MDNDTKQVSEHGNLGVLGESAVLAEVKGSAVPATAGALGGVLALLLALGGFLVGRSRAPRRKYRCSGVRAKRASDGRTLWLEKHAVSRVTAGKNDVLHVRVLGEDSGVAVEDVPEVRKALGLRARGFKGK